MKNREVNLFLMSMLLCVLFVYSCLLSGCVPSDIQEEQGIQNESGEKNEQVIQGEPGEKGDKGDQGEPGEKGDKGDQGEQGEQGIQGEPGEKGDKGDKGDKGEQGEIGPAGLSAYELYCAVYHYSGTIDEWYTLLTEQAKGDKGDTGEKGDKGDKGDQGEMGPAGLSAYELYCEVYEYSGTIDEWYALLVEQAKGDKGDTGDKGDKGDKGEQGEMGPMGLSAYELYCKTYDYSGTIDEWYALLIEQAKGEKGDKGDKGDQGERGEMGPMGLSAYELYCKTYDYSGTIDEWYALLIEQAKGEKGDTGEQGEKGETGEKGDKGEKGDTGATGLSAYELYCQEYGYEGTLADFLADLKGEKGETGEQGEKGETGEKGDKGDKGDTGDTGKSAFDLYCEVYGYDGTEEEWMAVINKELFTRYTVTFDLNGGVGSQDFNASVSVYPYAAYPLTEPTREGYDFHGWYTGDSVNSTRITDAHIVTKDVTLIARWAPVYVKVTFLDGNGDVLTAEQVKYGTNVTPPTAPTVEKMEYTGWDQDLTRVTENVTVQAQYCVKTYTVTYINEYGEAPEPRVCYFGDIPEEHILTHETLRFMGWFDEEGTRYEFETPFDRDVVLTAQFSEFIPIYTLEELLAIDGQSGHYVLMNDINCYNATITPIRTFKGVLDGNGHKIYALGINYIKSSTYDANAALIIRNYGTVKNLTVERLTMDISTGGTHTFAAAFVAINEGTIDNCHLINSLVSSRCGYTNVFAGIIGSNTPNGKVSNCSVKQLQIIHREFAYGNDNKSASVGGIVGNNQGLISSCLAEMFVLSSLEDGNPYGDKSRTLYIGGVVGYNYQNGTIQKCEVSMTATMLGRVGSAEGHVTYYAIGGICGKMDNNSTLDSNYAVIDLRLQPGTQKKCYYYVGGVVGNIASPASLVQNCHVAGQIRVDENAAVGLSTGGFFALCSGNISNSYSDVQIVIDKNNKIFANGLFGGHLGLGGSVTGCLAFGNLINDQTDGDNFFIDVQEGTTRYCYYSESAGKYTLDGQPVSVSDPSALPMSDSKLLSKDFIENELYWDTSVWKLTDNEHPVLLGMDRKYCVQRKSEDPLMGSVSDTMLLWYPAGGTVNVPLRAIPNEGYRFAGWYIGDELVSNEADTVYTIDGGSAQIVITAKFALQENLIYTFDDLFKIYETPNAHYKLMADLNGYNEIEWIPIPEFTGVFDGNGHTISGCTIYKATDKVAFIAVNRGVIKNLTLDFDVSTPNNQNLKMALFAAENDGTIENCYAVGKLNFVVTAGFYRSNTTRNYYLGSIAAVNYGTVRGCDVQKNLKVLETHIDLWSEQNSYSASTATTTYFYAGLLTGLNEGVVEQCELQWGFGAEDATITLVNNCITYYTVNDRGSANLYYYVGNIAGMNSDSGVIRRSSASGVTCIDVASYTDGKDVIHDWVVGSSGVLTHGYVGGITGGNYGLVEECFHSGQINHESYYYDRLGNGHFNVIDYVGGITGYSAGTVRNCVAGQYPAFALTNELATYARDHGGAWKDPEEGNDINVLSATTAYVGGIVGYNTSDVRNCLAQSRLKVHALQYKLHVALGWTVDWYNGNAYAGGITGYSADNAVISHCVSNCTFIQSDTPELAADAVYGSMTANNTGIVSYDYFLVEEGWKDLYTYVQGSPYESNHPDDVLFTILEWNTDVWFYDPDLESYYLHCFL